MICTTICNAWAFDAASTSAALVQSGSAERSHLQLDVFTATFPRFDAADASARWSRIDITLLPPSRSAIGLSLGLASEDGAGFLGNGSGGNPSLDIGLHWRHTLSSNYRVDVTAWRRLATPDALELVQSHQSSYGARVEMRIPVAREGLIAEQGFLGMQLESGARVTVRRKSGMPMIYFRNSF